MLHLSMSLDDLPPKAPAHLKKVLLGTSLLFACNATEPTISGNPPQTISIINNTKGFFSSVMRRDVSAICKTLIEPATLMVISHYEPVTQTREGYFPLPSEKAVESSSNAKLEYLLKEVVNTSPSDITAISLFGPAVEKEVFNMKIASISNVEIKAYTAYNPMISNIEMEWQIENRGRAAEKALLEIAEKQYDLVFDSIDRTPGTIRIMNEADVRGLLVLAGDDIVTMSPAQQETWILSLIEVYNNHAPLSEDVLFGLEQILKKQQTVSLKLQFRGEYKVISVGVPVLLIFGALILKGVGKKRKRSHINCEKNIIYK